MRPFLLILLLGLISLTCLCQQREETDTLLLTKPSHSIRKATLLSTFIPGAGQIYNKKYWKAPVVYTGLGICLYFIHENTTQYQFYRKNQIAALDDDPNTLNETIYTSAQLSQLSDDYRRLLDLSYISLAGVYVLNIIDAHVDAHLFYFDVSDELSLHVHPSLIPSSGVSTGVRLSLNF